jgi:hypothetical protein
MWIPDSSSWPDVEWGRARGAGAMGWRTGWGPELREFL